MFPCPGRYHGTPLRSLNTIRNHGLPGKCGATRSNLCVLLDSVSYVSIRETTKYEPEHPVQSPLHQGEPKGTVDYCVRGKEVSCLPDTNHVHHIWVELSLPWVWFLPREQVRSLVPHTRNMGGPEVQELWERPRVSLGHLQTLDRSDAAFGIDMIHCCHVVRYYKNMLVFQQWEKVFEGLEHCLSSGTFICSTACQTFYWQLFVAIMCHHPESFHNLLMCHPYHARTAVRTTMNAEVSIPMKRKFSVRQSWFTWLRTAVLLTSCSWAWEMVNYCPNMVVLSGLCRVKVLGLLPLTKKSWYTLQCCDVGRQEHENMCLWGLMTLTTPAALLPKGHLPPAAYGRGEPWGICLDFSNQGKARTCHSY